MANAVVKKKRRLKKTVRKTLGSLFLASALVTASIPVENMEAALPTGVEVGVDIEDCEIPLVSDTETIYTTGDGTYQFAYVSPNNISSNNKVAVILGYNGGYLNNGALTIPDTLDAYLKYSDNLGTSSGYAAVGKSGNTLFYSVDEPVLDNLGNVIYDRIPLEDENGDPLLDEDGEQLYEEVMQTKEVFYPCYYEDRSNWENLEVDEFYYVSGTDSEGNNVYALTITSDMQRIMGAEVWYIGNQYLESGAEAGTWKVGGKVTDSSKGIFASQGNIRTLTVGQKLSGIGDYAFFGCSGLNSITLGNGLDTIGNSSFENCINLTQVNIELYSRVGIIGAKAFYNCQALQEFTVPISVTAIGDAAFAECYNMRKIELCGDGANVSLTTLGPDVFAGCANLESITFPRTYTNNGQPIDISIFEDCTSLKFIAVSNNMLNFVDEKGYAFEDFKLDVPAEFYFEGLANSPLHETATEHNFAFSHLGLDLYEITIVDKDDPSIKAVYRVNSSNQLVYSKIDPRMTDVELPETIGPYKIQTIDSGTFQNNYNVEKVTIPSCIESIEANAFKGCYKLENVIFTEPVNIRSIGANAFKTQDVSVRDADGNLPVLPTEPVLKFTGTISGDSVLFNYAMTPENNINSGTQKRTYITYYSGWPENLEVRYNPDTDKNELMDYPTLKELRTGSKYTKNNYEYITPEYEAAAREAVAKYMGSESDRKEMTDYEWEIINAALAIVLPEGIEGIHVDPVTNESLFIEKEANEDNVTKSITAYSLREIAPYSFSGCTNLKSVYLLGATTSVGNYAFENCDELEEVYISESLEYMGIRPFKDCPKLDYVNFQGGPNFTCENAIIYELDDAGAKDKVVQYLLGRQTGVIEASEMTGISEIYPEAFMDTEVSSVDLRDSKLRDVPSLSFASTPNLFSVYLNRGCASISSDAFKDSALQYIEIPATVNYIDNDAFSGSTDKSLLTFYCEDDSNAKIYADKNNIKTTTKPDDTYYTVTFWDWDATLLDTQEVKAGMDAVPPQVPGRTGYIHTGWVPDYHGVNGDLQITAQYEAEHPDAHKLTVTFLDHDDKVLKTILVAPGTDAEPPIDPKREGYMFTGWRPAVNNIQEDTVIYAQYEKIDSTETQLIVRFIDHDDKVLYTQKVNYGESAILPQAPVRDGYTFTGWRPAINEITKDTDTYAQYEKNVTTNGGNGNGGNGNGGNGNGGSGDGTNVTSKLYTLTVRNGSGSGSYAAGSQPIIVADDPASGKEFAYWTIDPASAAIASKVLSATVVTMPEGNVTVTAHYKNKSTDSTTSNRPNSGNVPSTGGTSVVIDKNGLSNTGVVQVTVNGSSDNFTIKISETAEASESALKALKKQYGDLSGIKYFPFDISLYDSKGTTKIYDTTGLSISVTLPLPDSLVPYAGNNKVASVSDGTLESLKAKFTTVSGVPCITFTCEHFSPYVIYVNTENLTAGGVSDETPKTGDGIHPKWFLSLGLAFVALVLFMKKDKKLQTVKA